MFTFLLDYKLGNEHTRSKGQVSFIRNCSTFTKNPPAELAYLMMNNVECHFICLWPVIQFLQCPLRSFVYFFYWLLCLFVFQNFFIHSAYMYFTRYMFVNFLSICCLPFDFLVSFGEQKTYFYEVQFTWFLVLQLFLNNYIYKYSCIYTWPCLLQRDSFTFSFLTWDFFFMPNCLVEISSKILNRNGESRHLTLFLTLGGKHLVFYYEIGCQLWVFHRQLFFSD